jgi:hypothetical protein
MSGEDPREHLSPNTAIKADLVAWVGKLDDAVEQLYREIDRLPGLIRKEDSGADPEPDRSGPGSA